MHVVPDRASSGTVIARAAFWCQFIFPCNRFPAIIPGRQSNEERRIFRYTSDARRGWLDNLESQQQDRLEPFFGDIADARAVREAVRGCTRI